MQITKLNVFRVPGGMEVYEGEMLRYKVFGAENVCLHFIAMLNATAGLSVEELKYLEAFRDSIYRKYGGK